MPDSTVPPERIESGDQLSLGPGSVSEQLNVWITGDGPKTLGGLVDLFGAKSFAILFVLLLGLPALPLPTGGATHLLEIISVLLAFELVSGRVEVWLPQRWRARELAGGRQQQLISWLMRIIRRLERFSRPRMCFLFEHRLSNAIFGLLVIAGSLGAFLAPPFSGLDTLPALGVVLLSLGVLLTDIVVVAIALMVGVLGIALEISLGAAVFQALGALL